MQKVNKGQDLKYKYEGSGDFEGLIMESDIPKEDWKFGTEIILYSKTV